MSFISFSQNREDVMLWRALKHIQKGFYVDVGASDPRELSVTNAFYQNGWHGINIDPVTYELLCRDRTRDINLDVVIGSTEGTTIFYEVGYSALSTCDASLVEGYRKLGQKVIEREVPTTTLAQVLSDHVKGPIHFMNIDVEGSELDVLRSFDLAVWRPWIILVEATIPTTRINSYDKWEHLVLSSDYEFVYFDGLNRFYVAKEHHELTESFQLPPNIFDQYITVQQYDIQKELEKKENLVQEQNTILQEKEHTIQLFQKSYSYWILNGPSALLHKFHPVINIIRKIRSFFVSS